MPFSIVEDETYATNEVSMSNYCRFAQVAQSVPRVDDIEYEFDLGVELRSDMSNGAHYKFIMYKDQVKWSYLMAKKDLHSKLLKTYLLVNNFDFEVRDKGKLGDVRDSIDKLVVHYLYDPKPS